MFGALPAEVFGVGLVFCRVGAILFLLPGVGEQVVPPRIRLAFALVLALAFYPIVRGSVPPLSPTTSDLGTQVILEVCIGVALGALIRFFLGALAVAGETVSLQTSLSFAQTANPGQAQPTASLSAFLALLGLTLIFSSGLHHMFIGAIVNSYTVFPMGRPFSVLDFGQLAIRTFSETFALGIQLSAPVIVFALIFNLATGFIGRVMPQFQVFFVATPLSVLLGLSLFALSLGVFGLVWVDRFRTFLGRLV